MSPPAPVSPDAPPVSDAGLASQLRVTIARLSRRVRQESAIGGDNVTPSCMAALTSIEQVGPITLGELAAVERVQPPSMTRIVARLEELGLVTRVTDTCDRRVARVELTQAGRKLLARSRTRRDAFLAQRIARLTDAERAMLAAAVPLLGRLQDDAE